MSNKKDLQVERATEEKIKGSVPLISSIEAIVVDGQIQNYEEVAVDALKTHLEKKMKEGKLMKFRGTKALKKLKAVRSDKDFANWIRTHKRMVGSEHFQREDDGRVGLVLGSKIPQGSRQLPSSASKNIQELNGYLIELRNDCGIKQDRFELIQDLLLNMKTEADLDKFYAHMIIIMAAYESAIENDGDTSQGMEWSDVQDMAEEQIDDEDKLMEVLDAAVQILFEDGAISQEDRDNVLGGEE